MMKFSVFWTVLFTVCFFSFFSVAQDDDKLFQQMAVSGFRVPEYNEEGEMTSQFFGDHAEYESDGQVKITGARVEFYREDEVFLVVTSPYCYYDQDVRDARSDAPVSAKMDGFLLTGEGFHLGVESQTVEVMNKSRVVVKDAMQGLTEEASKPEAEKTVDSSSEEENVTTITSKQLFLNYTNRTALFVDSVHVQNPSLELDSGSLDIKFTKDDNTIDTLEALKSSRLVIIKGIKRIGPASEPAETDAEKESDVAETNKADETNTPTVVTSQQMFLDYTGRFARFKDDVHVEDAKLVLDSGVLNLRFGENNEINWIEALSNVKLISEGQEAYAGRIVYETEQDEFLLEQNPKVVQGRNMLFGDTIRFWRATKRMICEPAAHVVFFPEEKFEKDILE